MLNSFVIRDETGEELELIDDELCTLINVEGLNPVAATIATKSQSCMNRSWINGVNIYSRNIVLTINISYPIEENRNTIYNFLLPGMWVELDIVTDIGEYCINGVVESFENNHFGMKQQPVVSIICPEPFFKNPILYRREITLDKSFNINGHYDAPCKITAQAVNDIPLPFGLKNNSNGRKIILKEAFQFSAGEKLIIDTENYNVWGTVSGATVNLTPYIDLTSDWICLNPGSNTLSLTGNGTAEDVKITIEYNEIYGGI